MKLMMLLVLGVARSLVWPLNLALLSFVARNAPWPQPIAQPSARLLFGLALAWFGLGVSRFLWKPKGWAETSLHAPESVARQSRRAARGLILLAVLTLLPLKILAPGIAAPGWQAVQSPALCRGLQLAFEIGVWLIAFRLLRERSALMRWLVHSPQTGGIGSWRKLIAFVMLSSLGAIIGLDAGGYSLTASRCASGLACIVLIFLGSLLLRWLLHRAIDHAAWRWVRHPKSTDPSHAHPHGSPEDDLAGRLRRLTNGLVPIVSIALSLYVFQVDLALFRSVFGQKVWTIGAEEALTIGDLSLSAAFLAVTIGLWHYAKALFTLVVYPRMSDDEGARFAVLSLFRYAALLLGSACVLSSLHLGMEKIGVVLAALGVGVGFGLQEIVANFVSGLILLIERPIRVGDVVTVAGMTGRVDRINIRATTILNWDNQSLIIPNREFITGNLTNWTHKDKIIRLVIPIGVAYGTNPDMVSECLLAIARENPDVLRNPVPVAVFERFQDSALMFVLYVHLPEPSLIPRVRHALCAEIQRRFLEAEIKIPFPIQEIHLKAERAAAFQTEHSLVPTQRWYRHDGPEEGSSPSRRPAGERESGSISGGSVAAAPLPRSTSSRLPDE